MTDHFDVDHNHRGLAVVESLLIVFREVLEAGLIVAIVLAYLGATNRQRYAGPVWLGVGAGLLLASVVGGVAFFTFGGLEGTPRRLAFAAINLLAVAVLTYTVVWMREQARGLRGSIHQRIDTAASQGSLLALAALAFFAVLREGIETVLFMLAVTATASPLASAAGSVLGLGLAVLVCFLVYRGGSRVQLRTFFNVTSVLLMLFAAGLLAKAVLYLQGAGVMPVLLGSAWDLSGYEVLTTKHLVGQFLRGLFGWDPKPSFEELVAYLGYLAAVGWALFRARRPEGVPNHRPVGA